MNKMKRKPLQSQALIYDKDCPMCCIYTSAFIKAGVLEEKGRQPYNEQASDSVEWDAERAKNEIALVNYENGTVTYGIDSMFKVIGHRFSFLKPLFNWKPFHWSMKKFYSFISYNRKVIAPPAKNIAEITCVPDVNYFYRWLYIAVGVFLTGAFSAGGLSLFKAYALAPIMGGIIAIIILRLAVQSLLVTLVEKKTVSMDYLGNLVTINLQLGFLVGLMFTLTRFTGVESSWMPIFLLATSIYVNTIHARRLRSLNLSTGYMFLWVLQWVLIVLTPVLINPYL